MEAERLNQVSQVILDAAFRVHTALGSGLLESAYEHCLWYELNKQSVRVDRQLLLPIHYDGLKIDATGWICWSSSL